MATDNTEPTVRRWSVAEYYQMGELGWFEGQRVEFIAGRVWQKSPQEPSHCVCASLTQSALSAAFGAGYCIRSQHPLRLSDEPEPEPDIAVVPGGPRDFMTAHPTTAELVVDVSVSSLNFDRRQKSSLYASFGLPEYWLLDVDNRRLDIFRQPVVELQEERDRQQKHHGDDGCDDDGATLFRWLLVQDVAPER